MSTGGSVANPTTGQSALQNTPVASKGTTPAGETTGVLKNPFAVAGKGETKQPPSKANNDGVKKDPHADANKGETNPPPAQVNKGETKNPPAKDNVASNVIPAQANTGETKKEPPAEGNKGETKQPPAEVNKGETKNPPTKDGVTSKESPAPANKGEAQNPPTKDNDASKKEPAAEGSEGGTKEPAAEGSAEDETWRKPFSETTAAVAYYIDEFGNRKRYCGAARKRFMWLVNKGFTEEEARGLAHHGMQKLQPFTALKQNFADDDVIFDSASLQPRRAPKRPAADDLDEQPPTPPTPPPAPKKKKKKKLRKDRTFHEPPAVVKASLGGIRVGLIPATYPDALLSSEQLKLLRFTVLEQLVPQKQGGFQPKFLGTSAKPGFIIFHCEDDATVLWLKTVLDKLSAVVDADLRALEHYQIPRKLAIVGYFPNKRRESIAQIFDTIKEHNEGLNVDTWVLHKLITIKGVTQAIIAVDHQSAEKLIKDDFKINFRQKVLQLKPDVKFEKNVEVTVYIPKDPKEGSSRPWNKWWNPKLPRPPKFEGVQGPGGPGAPAMGIEPEGSALGPRPVGAPPPSHGPPSWHVGPKGANPGPRHQNPMWDNGPPNQNPMFGNGPPNQNPMFGSGPPNQNPMFGSGPPNQNLMFGSGPHNQNPMFGSGPPNQNPMFGNRHPNQNPMFGNGPPNQNRMFGNAPPNQNPMFDNGPPKPFLAVCPPGPPQGPMHSQTGPSSYNMAPVPPRNEPRFDPQMVEPSGQMKRALPPSGLEREQGFTRGNPNFNSASQEVTQIAPLNRNPTHGLLPESERPVRERRQGDYPSRPLVSEAERPRRDVSRDRVFTESDRPPWARRGHTSEEALSARRPRDNPRRDSSTDVDGPHWNAPRGRFFDRGSASEDGGPRLASSRDRFSNRGSESVADRRPRSRSRHSPNGRFETEADRRQLTRHQVSYSGPDAGRPSRNLEYSENRYVAEADRRPRDASRDTYSNSGLLPESERPPPVRPRDYADLGPGVEADMHPRGPPDSYLTRGPANQVPPRGISPERFSNRATIDTIGRPRDRPQEVYQSSEVEADRHPRGISRERYPDRGRAVEDLGVPWAASRDRNRSGTHAPEAILRDSSRDRFSNRGSTTEDDRWGAPRDRSSTHGSASDAGRPQWASSRDVSLRGRPRERRPIPGPATDEVAPPWARQDKTINESPKPEWTGSRGDFSNRRAAPESIRPPRSTSREDSRKDNRPPWAESGDSFERRGRDTEPRGPLRGTSGDRMGPSRESFPNRGSAMEVDERPPWASPRGRFPNREPTVADRRPPPPRAVNINRDLSVEDGRPQWGTSRDGYTNRDATVDEPPRDRSRERLSVAADERSHWGPSRAGYSGRPQTISQGQHALRDCPGPC